jgi:C4-dicarboxylate transporter/malic acid transport protein
MPMNPQAGAAPAASEPSQRAAAMHPEEPQSRLQGLHPGWFAAAMGTAILAVATYANPGNITALQGVAHMLGIVLAVLAYAVGAALLVAYTARWLGHTEAALADLRHPGFGGLHATLPGGLLVLAVMTSVVGPAMFPASVVQVLIATLAVVGGILALVVGVAFSYVLFTSEVPAPSVNGGWFIPPVVTIIIPMVLAPLIPAAAPDIARLLLFVGYACFGMGFLLFLFIMGVLHDRLVLHPLPPAQMAPSLWIALGPVAVAILAPLSLARAGQPLFGTAAPTIVLISQLFGTALWGFGLWWLAIAVTLLIRYLRAGKLPFHLGWWAFTFPVGAFTVATMNLAAAWQLPALDLVAGVLYLMLTVFWATVTVQTLQGLRTGHIWRR